MGIGLGSLVVRSPDDGLVMVIAATAGEEMFCVSTDQQKTIKQWCHRSALKQAERAPTMAGAY